jgi:hypothetical protein
MTAAAYQEVRMGAELNPAQQLHALGQSLWLDSINRVMLRTGALARYVRELAVTGLTSNPTILGHAMAAGSDYDSSLARLVGEGVTGAQDLVYALALGDLAEAAALFRPEWTRTPATASPSSVAGAARTLGDGSVSSCSLAKLPVCLTLLAHGHSLLATYRSYLRTGGRS